MKEEGEGVCVDCKTIGAKIRCIVVIESPSGVTWLSEARTTAVAKTVTPWWSDFKAVGTGPSESKTIKAAVAIIFNCYASIVDSDFGAAWSSLNNVLTVHVIGVVLQHDFST